jgi:hypothetical protein
MSLDFRPEKEKKKEDALICSLTESETLYSFMCTVLFKMIQKAKAYGLTKDYIQSLLKAIIIKTKDGIVLQKAGYQCTTSPGLCSRIVSAKTYHEFYTVNRKENISLLNLMGAFYRFQVDNIFARLCIEHDPALKAKFMNAARQYFSLPVSMTYEQLKQIADKSYGKWFYLFVLTYMSSNKHNFVRHYILNQKDYIRQPVIPFPKLGASSTRKNYSAKKLKRSITCKQRQYENQPVTNILRGNTYYTPTKNSIWFNLMKHFKKEINSGPSGSSIITYQSVFEVAKVVSPTRRNKILLLLCILADYYYYYHTLSEVLQEYSSEAGLPRYDLSMNDVEYIERLRKQVKV